CGKKNEQGDENQSGNLKNVQQPLPADDQDRKNSHKDSANQTSELLSSLQDAHNFLLVGVHEISDSGSAGNNPRKMLQHSERRRIGAGHHQASQQCRFTKFGME